MIAYIDRVSVGFAKLQMLADLHFSDTVFGLGASAPSPSVAALADVRHTVLVPHRGSATNKPGAAMMRFALDNLH